MILIGISLFLFLEGIIFILFLTFKKKFKWLIGSEDEIKTYDNEALKKFYNTSYDKKIGWVRKPSTSGVDKGGGKVIPFNIDEFGSRKSILNPRDAKVVTIGDSYTFCRQVGDEQTWQNVFAQMSNESMLNYGVGNYGIDQAIMRFENVYIPENAQYAVLGFVPETISRIQSYWKHYLEFGNTFAFKPRYKLEDDKLVLVKQYIDEFEKYFCIKENISWIRSNDKFYQSKFLKHRFKFSYLISFLRNLKFNSIIFYYLLADFFVRDERINDKLFDCVVKFNLIDSQKLYLEKDSKKLLKAILEHFVKICKLKKLKPIILVIPQLHDLRSTPMYHQEFFETLRIDSEVIDMTKIFSDSNFEELYVDDYYGGHLSVLGNKTVGEILYKRIFL